MTAIVVSNATTFGAMSNEMVNKIREVHEHVTRLESAAANAASGYTGEAGTEFETGSNFGVLPSSTAGAQGTAWRYQIDGLSAAWATFMTAASGYIDALDNG